MPAKQISRRHDLFIRNPVRGIFERIQGGQRIHIVDFVHSGWHDVMLRYGRVCAIHTHSRSLMDGAIQL